MRRGGPHARRGSAWRVSIVSALTALSGVELTPAWSQPSATEAAVPSAEAAAAPPEATAAAPPEATAAAPPEATMGATAPEAAAPAPSATSGGTATAILGGAALRRAAPPPPPPSAKQLAAMSMLLDEARLYEQGARDYRNTVALIVRHHYEAKRRRVLTALDGEIRAETAAVTVARDEAIARLEDFVARYRGDRADPRATPDAMFRLAALYEERARLDLDADLGQALEPALALYRQLIAEFSAYDEIAAVHYFLGHALTDAGRLDEGQQAWRALVCRDRYRVRDDPKRPGRIAIEPLAQDHDTQFWQRWYNENPLPLDANAIGAKRVTDVSRVAAAEELSFRDPYPAACEALPQRVEPDMEPRYLAEIWWQIGNYHFDQIDPAGGPYNLNRAVSAYRHSLAFVKPPLHGVALYKQAWTHFKQQRYRRATEEFVRLLRYADAQEAESGDPGVDFRSEAYTYIGASLTYVDFEGPPANHPAIPRNDVLDTESNALAAEQKMAIAIQRVQDPDLIPQDQKWTVEIYKALAREFIEITQNRNALATLELVLARFPLDRDAPLVQDKVAELYETLSRLAPEGSAARDEYATKALTARTQLKDYVGLTAWTEANKGDPEALHQAEQLASQGLRRAAADRTNQGKAHYTKALELSDQEERSALLERAVAEYRSAADAWRAYYEQDPLALDGYESRFWWADAAYHLVVLQIALGRTPDPAEVAAAEAAAVAVRDSNEDDKYLQPAAYYLVTMADRIAEDQWRLYEESRGGRGVPRRTEVAFEGEGRGRVVRSDPIPDVVLATVRARDAYNARIPVDRDPAQNGPLYAFQSAEVFFLYGDFAEAQRRYAPIYEAYCGRKEWGYLAWEKLISMSNFSRDARESRRLAEAKSCAVTAEQKGMEAAIRKPVSEIAAYLDAGAMFEAASQLPEGPAREQKWREAAAAYRVALEKAPGNDNAPEAAMNGAFAYKQVGEYDRAIEMYELFIGKYGSDAILTKLREGDPKASPPRAAEPGRYETRVRYLKDAYDALASSYVLFFTYPKAAETFEKIASKEHFAAEHRRDAARQALALYASLTDGAGMRRAREQFQVLGASPQEGAEADFVVASAELKKWDEFSPDTGANETARFRALRAMEEYYARNVSQNAAAPYVVRAAYWVAKLRRAGRGRDVDGWWRKTITAFERYRAVAPRRDGQSSALGTLEAGMAAEAEYTRIDASLARQFDYDSGHHRYRGTVVEVINAYKKDAVDAKRWYDELQHVADAYLSPEWTAIAISRQGSLYDSLRTGLYNTRPPALRLVDAVTEAKLKRAEESGNPELMEKADAVRVRIQQAWRAAREKELESADQIMITRYATAVVLGRRYNVANGEITRAIRRLAFFTDVIGEARMASYVGRVKDLDYRPGLFMKQRPGLSSAPKPEVTPLPLPAVVVAP